MLAKLKDLVRPKANIAAIICKVTFKDLQKLHYILSKK